MSQVTATLSNYRQSPRRVRLVANLIRGKKVSAVLAQLDFLAKRAGMPVKKLIESAIANAKNLSISTDDLYVSDIQVNQGITMKRSMPRARGRASAIHKRSSHVKIVLNTEKPTKKAKQIAHIAKTS